MGLELDGIKNYLRYKITVLYQLTPNEKVVTVTRVFTRPNRQLLTRGSSAHLKFISIPQNAYFKIPFPSPYSDIFLRILRISWPERVCCHNITSSYRIVNVKRDIFPFQQTSWQGKKKWPCIACFIIKCCKSENSGFVSHRNSVSANSLATLRPKN